MKKKSRTFDRFTEQARQALVAAQQEAQRLGHTLIGPEHLLLGIISLPESLAVRVLRELEVDLEMLRGSVEERLQSGNPLAGQVGLMPGAKKVIESAVNEARRVQHQYLGSEHFLLGILSSDEEALHNLLNQQGATLEAARERAVRLHSEGVTEAPGGPLELSEQQRTIELSRKVRKARAIYFFMVIVCTVLGTLLVLLNTPLSSLLSRVLNTLIQAPVLSWQPLPGWSPMLVLADFVLASVLLLSISIPFSWYTTFALPHRYGVGKYTKRSWWSALSRGLLLYFGQIWLLLEIVTLLMVVQPQTWWAWAALTQFFYSLLKARFGTRWYRWLSGKMEPLPAGELTERFHTLLQRLHLPACGLFQLKVDHRTEATNAFFVGVGKGRHVILTDTMVQKFSLDEIEVIMAHELAHFVHHDIWKRLVLRSLLFLGVFLFFYEYLTTSHALHYSTSSVSVVQVFLPLVIFLALFGFIALILRYNRYQEHQADEFALRVTGKVQTFKTAMSLLTHLRNQAVTSVQNARYATHPTLVKRLQHADKFAARNAPPFTVEQS